MSSEYPLAITHSAASSRFSMVTSTGEEAELTYHYVSPGNASVIFDHTYTPNSARGQGLAGQLVFAGMEWAKREKLSVGATCSYVVHWLSKHPEYNII